MRVNQDLVNLVLNGSAAERKFACKQPDGGFYLFKIFYFSDYFTYEQAPFHDDFDCDVERLISGELTEAAWIAFRESAKTAEAKMALCYIICYRLKRYIGYASYDKENAEAALFDVIVELQTNPKLIADFGHLYTEKRERDESKMKRISSFITSNKIKVEAFSTQESTRGRLYMKHRPDFFILDDIETLKTRDSFPVTNKIIRFIRELKAGMGNGWAVLYLGNYISEVGVIAYVMNRIQRNPKGIIRNVPVMVLDSKTKQYRMAWPDKYVMTDQEALVANRSISDPMQHKISIESKKRDLDNFNEDMMNDPVSAGQPFFDRRKIDEDMAKCDAAKEDKADFLLWRKYNPSHRYAIGADTSKGIGLDSNTSVLMDFSLNPCEQVGSYASNEIAPDVFAHELKREATIFGECLIAPETNAESGGTCMNELRKIYPIESIYRPLVTGKVKEKPTNKLGWETNAATKPEAFFQFKKAYEDGLLKINDIRILREMRSYTKNDLSNESSESTIEETTRHFDLLTAAVICWMMKDHAEVADAAKLAYVQPAYQAPGIEAIVDEPVVEAPVEFPSGFRPHRR